MINWHFGQAIASIQASKEKLRQPKKGWRNSTSAFSKWANERPKEGTSVRIRKDYIEIRS